MPSLIKTFEQSRLEARLSGTPCKQPNDDCCEQSGISVTDLDQRWYTVMNVQKQADKLRNTTVMEPNWCDKVILRILEGIVQLSKFEDEIDNINMWVILIVIYRHVLWFSCSHFTYSMFVLIINLMTILIPQPSLNETFPTKYTLMLL